MEQGLLDSTALVIPPKCDFDSPPISIGNLHDRSTRLPSPNGARLMADEFRYGVLILLCGLSLDRPLNCPHLSLWAQAGHHTQKE